MSYSSSSRYPRQKSSARTSGSSSSSSTSGAPPGNLETRRFLDSIARTTSPPYESPYSPAPTNQHLTVPGLRQAATTSTYRDPTRAVSMSAYSSSSDQGSVYSSPGPQDYQVVTASMTSNPRNLSKVSPRVKSHIFAPHNKH